MGGDIVQQEVGVWLRTWEMLPSELQAFALLVFSVIGITWVLRETAFYHLPKRKRASRIRGSAFIVGLVGGLITWYINDSVGMGVGLMLCSTSGMTAIFIHHLIVNTLIPIFRKNQPRRRNTDL